MAGEMVASGLLDAVLEKLVSGSLKEFARLWGVEGDLKSLESTLSTIKAVLQDAEEKVVRDKSLHDWLAKLKYAAYDADDLLDEFHMEAERRKLEIRGQMIKKVLHFFSLSNPVVFRVKMAHKIKNMRKRMDDIAAERTKFHLQIKDIQDWGMVTSSMGTMSQIDEASVCGRDEDKEAIMHLLLDTETEKNVSIIPIVGMGGLGKTTLAQLLYDEMRVKEKHFHLRMWVYVSADFDLTRIARAAVEAATNKKCDFGELETISRHLDGELMGKRFLLVLDDLWNENEDELDKLKSIFKNGMRGSKIIVTTRKQTVALKVGTTSPYNLKALSDADCWTLFKQRAFAGRAEEENPELVAIGKEIVSKCGGIPLAAKALGSMMRFKEDREAWEAVRDGDMWKQREEGQRVLASLRLSYTHLQPRLKQCFAYCSIFPKGYKIDKDTLIAQWIAQGFIPSSHTSVQLENEYFNNLVWASFLQDVKEDKHSGRVTCKMHDLVHDLAQSVAGDEVSVINQVSTSLPEYCRYARLVGDDFPPQLLTNILKKVRGLHFDFNEYFIDDLPCPTQIPKTFFLKARCLRSLKMNNVLLPSSIERLKNLRYLKLSRLQFDLPKSICNLQNLQTLHISDCDDLKTLPECIGTLQNLKILVLFSCENLESLPESTSNLENLCTMNLIECESLQALPNSFGNLQNLRRLGIPSCIGLQALPDSIGNLRMLKYLDASGLEILKELPDSIGGLQNLQSLNLSGCEKLETLPESIGNLHNLRSLDLEFCVNLKELPACLGNLKGLRHLNNADCDMLMGMPPRMGQLTNLQTLSLFVVGKDEARGGHTSGNRYADIAELEHLNLIEGGLEITGLENVKSPSDAQRAKLKEKRKLRQLCLSWSSNSKPEGGEDEAILEGLQPHPNIWSLKLNGFLGTKFPQWMTENGVVLLPNLSDLQLSNLQNCERFPPLGQLPSLVSLRIARMSGVKLVGLELYGDHHGTWFPSLKDIAFVDMPNLEEWLTSTMTAEDGGDSDQVSAFPCLNSLKISNCPKLRVKPCFPMAIETLTLERSNEELLSEESLLVRRGGRKPSTVAATSSPSSILKELCISEYGALSGWKGLKWLTALRILRIRFCDTLSCLPENIGNLTSLQQLKIEFCDTLSYLPESIGNLTYLQQLKIESCDTLSCLPESIGNLISLQQLQIWNCDTLSYLPESIGNLISLQQLDISYCNTLSCLPESIGNLTFLQQLDISNCNTLNRLPESIGNLTSLQQLTIESCDTLSCLPESIGRLTSLQELEILECPLLCTLPEGLKRLTNLKKLSLTDVSPALVERCQREHGEDWHKIAHIPDVEIQ